VETFTAFGLRIRAGFSLPGLRPAAADAGDLPRVDLQLETPRQLEERWSGAASNGAWRGRLAEGQELTIAWGRERDLLFRYGDRARFLLSAGRGRLSCAPADFAAPAWRRTLISRILPNIAIARGYEALHASAVLTELGVVAVAAPSGTGKSTLARELERRGWPLFADDTVVLGRAGRRVEAHPAVKDEVVRPDSVAAALLLERTSGLPLRAAPLDPSPLALAPFMLGLPDDDGRDHSRFELYADLVAGGCRILRLTADPADPPGDLADTLEQALGLNAPVLSGGVG
jgi:hypothetical protein